MTYNKLTGKELSRRQIYEILKILEETYNGAETALKYKTPFQLLISTMLAAQSTDKRVNIVTEKLFKDYPDAASMRRLSEDQIREYIKTVGLYKAKAKNILKVCEVLDEKYGGDIPATREELMALPGVGRKTANVVLSIAKNVPAIAVDTHVFRVSNRIGLAQAKDVLNTEKQLMESIPKEKWSQAHHWLIWHGRKICRARNPLCTECPLNRICLYYRQNEKEDEGAAIAEK
ncbi:endonuclease III [Caldithrix abyssi]